MVIPSAHSLYTTTLMLLHVIISFWSHLSAPMMGRMSQEQALNGPEHFTQAPHSIHDEMIDASPGTGPHNIHDFVPEDNVSIVMNIEELFEEQDEMKNMEAEGKNITIFSY
jgi:hypothetical protein